MTISTLRDEFADEDTLLRRYQDFKRCLETKDAADKAVFVAALSVKEHELFEEKASAEEKHEIETTIERLKYLEDSLDQSDIQQSSL